MILIFHLCFHYIISFLQIFIIVSIFKCTCVYYCIAFADAPSNVIATVLTSRSVQVTWDPPAPVSNVTSYIIVFTTTASYASDGSLTVHGYNTTRDILNNLEENTLYTIIVQAFANSSGRSGDSEEATVTTYTDGKHLVLEIIVKHLML